jgi:serine/threonine protein kinase
MEFVDGVALGSKIYGPASQKLSLDEIVNILYEITLGVQHAHSRGVIHRDIKPDNILLSTTGEVKITDFGLARTLEVDKGFTNTGETVGTPYYMSPEQIRGDAPDKRSDIYSLGILAYELVSGRRPFNDECWFTLAAMHLNQPLPKLESKLNLPRWYEDFVQIATAKKPAERFQSMDDVVDLLEGELRRDRGIVRASKTRLAKRNHRLIPTGSLSPRAKMVGLCLATALVVAALGFFFPHSNFVP